MVCFHDIRCILLCHSKQNITVQCSHDSSSSCLVSWALTAECVVVAHDFSAGTVINVFANNLNGSMYVRFGVRWTPDCLNHIMCFFVSRKLKLKNSVRSSKIADLIFLIVAYILHLFLFHFILIIIMMILFIIHFIIIFLLCFFSWPLYLIHRFTDQMITFAVLKFTYWLPTKKPIILITFKMAAVHNKGLADLPNSLC